MRIPVTAVFAGGRQFPRITSPEIEHRSSHVLCPQYPAPAPVGPPRRNGLGLVAMILAVVGAIAMRLHQYRAAAGEEVGAAEDADSARVDGADLAQTVRFTAQTVRFAKPLVVPVMDGLGSGCHG